MRGNRRRERQRKELIKQYYDLEEADKRRSIKRRIRTEGRRGEGEEREYDDNNDDND